MGYTTKFAGKFTLDRPLSEAQAEYLKVFAGTRRMKRAAVDVAGLPDPEREAVCLSLGGPDAPYFVGGGGFRGQGQDKSVRDYNEPPNGQPGLWCQWVPTEDRCGLEWDGGEKFYDYKAWLEYIIQHFLVPWGFVLNGAVRWQGEELDDRGFLYAENNVVRSRSLDDLKVEGS